MPARPQTCWRKLHRIDQLKYFRWVHPEAQHVWFRRLCSLVLIARKSSRVLLDRATVGDNSLPFRSDLDTAAHEMALDRLIDATPGFPLTTVEQASL